MSKKLTHHNDRALPYRVWRWDNTIDKQWVMDIDQIEFTYLPDGDGEALPIGIIETTYIDSDTAPPAYLDKILERYAKDAQGSVVKWVAKRIGCKAFIVLFTRHLETFYVYNLTNNRGWWTLTEENYLRWLRSLNPNHTPTEAP